ncbi:hypothetical protein EJ03DRAFT_246528, partial [Teratosphaeria nubilosa]
RTTSSPCASIQCLDFLNPCGQMYGGCFPACGNSYTTPAFSDPGCPATTTTAAAATEARIAAALAATSTCDSTACVDKINDCGVRYGACYADCEGYATPTFTAPVCATSASAGVEDVVAVPPVT